MNEEKVRKKPEIFSLIEDIIFYVIVIPLIILVVIILWQKILHPEKIPDIYGYKMFIVLDENMDESVYYGDLVFTKNIEPKELKNNDLIAFRNYMNTVTLHKIIAINNKDGNIIFTMKTVINETNDTKYAKEEAVEGIVVHRITKIGLILIYMQDPFVLLLLVSITLIIGLIAYYIAQELDKRDMVKPEENNEKVRY